MSCRVVYFEGLVGMERKLTVHDWRSVNMGVFVVCVENCLVLCVYVFACSVFVCSWCCRKGNTYCSVCRLMIW
jgi:hypothetical protein